MLVLGIETSCDETSAAVVADGKDILQAPSPHNWTCLKNTAGWCQR